MDLVVRPDGTIRCVYDESLDLDAIGRPSITRASHVEPDGQGGWLADLSLVNGPLLRPFPRRSQALTAERNWLEANWLTGAEAR
jgi:hypothetical protein